MDNRNYRNHKYTAEYDERNTARSGRAGRKDSSRRRAGEEIPDFLYDARGTRVKKGSRVLGDFLKTLFFFVIPYLVINTAIFLMVTSAPKIRIDPISTDDYRSATVTFTVHSLMPLEDMVVTLESENLPYRKAGSSCSAFVVSNGTFYVEATAKNGMRSVAYADIAVLDDTPPIIDDTSCHIEDGLLTFNVSDTQSGIDWSRIYALDADGNRHVPETVDRETGTVYMPMEVDFLELHVFDMVGNERTANVTATTEQITVKGPAL